MDGRDVDELAQESPKLSYKVRSPTSVRVDAVDDVPEDLDGPAVADTLFIGRLFPGLLLLLLPLPLAEAEDESGSRTARSAERGWIILPPPSLDEKALGRFDGGGVGVLRSDNVRRRYQHASQGSEDEHKRIDSPSQSTTCAASSAME